MKNQPQLLTAWPGIRTYRENVVWTLYIASPSSFNVSCAQSPPTLRQSATRQLGSEHRLTAESEDH
eukprot:1733749-Rhodomonas_salina.3